jgi:hypothetical protein
MVETKNWEAKPGSETGASIRTSIGMTVSTIPFDGSTH